MALKKMNGVEDAEVSYETGSAVVVFDPALTTPETFIAELYRLTDFAAEVVAPDAGMHMPAGHDTTAAHR